MTITRKTLLLIVIYSLLALESNAFILLVVRSKFITIPITTETEDLQIFVPRILCDGGSGVSNLEDGSSHIELFLKVDPITLRANCIWILNLILNQINEATGQNITAYLTFSPLYQNILNYSFNHFSRFLSPDELFIKTQGSGLRAPQPSTPTE